MTVIYKLKKYTDNAHNALCSFKIILLVSSKIVVLLRLETFPKTILSNKISACMYRTVSVY